MQPKQDINFANIHNGKNTELSTLEPCLFHNVATLPLSIFMKCYLDNDYSLLCIEGEATDEQLKNVYDTIIIDYYDLINSPQTRIFVSLQKQVVKTVSRIKQVSAFLQMYMLCKNEKIKQNLSNLGFYFQKDTSTEVLLAKYSSFIKHLQIELDNKLFDIKTLTNPTGEAAETTRTTFINNIIVLSKHNGYAIDENNLTVEKYCLLLNNFNEYVELNNNG
jgi:hypothetical protein